MRRSLDVYLWEARKHAAAILDFVASETLETYSANTMLRLAVERVFTLLGEALVRMRLHFPDDFDKIIESTRVVRFRNRLVHMYDLMTDAEVWRVIQDVLPVMITQIDSMTTGLKP